jgi:sugar lactone lactonase YvrE
MPARDSNGDSIPDGYCVLNGLDPRSPILPLSPGWNSLGALNGANTASGKFGVPAPTRVVVRGAILFALDTGNNRVQVWNRETMAYGGSYGSGGSASGAFSQPFGLALDPRAGTNRFAVADTQNHRVQVFGFDPLSGTNIAFQFQFGSMGGGSGQFRNPNGVAFGPDGKIFVADTGNGVDAGNSRIQMFSDAGTYLATIATSGTNAGQVHMPRGLCVSEEGIVVVADTGNSRIQAFDQAGSNLWSVGSLGTNALQFWEPRGVQTGVGGRLYVADSGNSRLQVLTPGGAWLGTLGPRDFTGNQVLNRPYDVAPALDSGVAYVADTFNGRVRAISVVLDGDADGMNDLWEAVYGLDPTVNDAMVDSNGDGVLNIGEYRTGQNPAEGGLIQALRITQFKVSPPVLKWETVSTGGVYRIEYSCDSSRMASNSWNSSAVVTSQVAGALAVTNALTVTNRVQYFRVIKIGP